METVTTFHEGELAVQRRAGVADTAAKVGRIIESEIPPAFAAFLATRQFLVVAREEDDGRVWASLVTGRPGFARALDEHRLLIEAPRFGADGAAVGVLAIEPHTRSRIRLNGLAQLTSDGVVVTVTEAFGNCTKYIRRRVPVGPAASTRDVSQTTAARLDARGRELVAAADTFFIASAHPRRGADASHRGGPPGFVEVAADGTRLAFPDFAGNRMFQTLGNLTVDPRAGLLFVDWESGSTLEVSGRAAVAWDGTDRTVEFDVEAVRERPGALGARWEAGE